MVDLAMVSHQSVSPRGYYVTIPNGKVNRDV